MKAFAVMSRFYFSSETSKTTVFFIELLNARKKQSSNKFIDVYSPSSKVAPLLIPLDINKQQHVKLAEEKRKKRT